MKFSLVTVAYVFALLAAGMAAFGGGAGLWLAIAVLVFWAWAYYGPAPTAVGCAVSALVVLALLALLLPSVQSAREVARRNVCLNNLKQISLALQNHIEVKGSLPAAATFDASSNALHSWRTAILPYMEQRALHSQIALDQPWNSSINRGYTVDMQVETYRCPAHGTAAATGHYLAVVGERTAWPPGRGRKLDEVTDGTANTVMVIEAPWMGVSWAEPRDLSFDEAVEYLTRKPKAGEIAHVVHPGFFYKPQPVVHGVFMNGWPRALPLPLPRETAVALLTVDGGEPIDEAAFDVERAAELDYGRCYAFGAFVVLAVAPAMRLRRRRRDRGDKPHGSL
jgi:type II secretory pathway pseudopilin PulG